MEFALPPEIDAIRARIRRFVDERLIPLESDRANYDPELILAEDNKSADQNVVVSLN